MAKINARTMAKQIIESYKEDHSKEGILEIFDYVDLTTDGKGLYNIIMAHNEMPFLTQNQVELFKRLYNEHKSYNMIKRRLKYGGFLSYFFEGKTPVELCGYKYLEGEDLKNYMHYKKTYDANVAMNKKMAETAKKMVELYIKLNDCEAVVNEIDCDYKSFRRVKNSFFHTNPPVNYKRILSKIGRHLINTRNGSINGRFSEIVELIDSDDPIELIEHLTKKPKDLRDDLVILKEEEIILLDEEENVKKVIQQYHNLFYAIRNADEYQERVRTFIDNGNPDLEKYCEENSLSLLSFKFAVNRLRILNLPIVEEYDEFVKVTNEMKQEEANKDGRKQVYSVVLSKLRKIAYQIRNGIPVGDEFRDFDLIDYYRSTKLSLDETRKLMVQLNGKDFGTLDWFTRKFEYDGRFSFQQVLDTIHTVGVEYDEKGNLIPGSGRVVTEEEKRAAFAFLKRNDLPITNSTYQAALNRIIKGYLVVGTRNFKDDQEESESTKQKKI